MTKEDAHKRLDFLINRSGGESPQIIGILIVDETGDTAVSMDSNDEVDILEIGHRGRRRQGGIAIDRDLGSITPTLERV